MTSLEINTHIGNLLYALCGRDVDYVLITVNKKVQPDEKVVRTIDLNSNNGTGITKYLKIALNSMIFEESEHGKDQTKM